MKNHEQMYQSLLSRWDEYQEQEKKLLFERKHRIKKMCLVLAITASAIVGCMSLGFGGYAVWNYVVKPIIIEEKKPEHPITTQATTVAQTENHTEITVKYTEPMKTESPFETTVTVAQCSTEELTGSTAAITTITSESVTDPRKEIVNTEPAETTTLIVTAETITTATEAVTVKDEADEAIADYKTYLKDPASVKSTVELDGKQYYVVNTNIGKGEIDNYELTWKDEVQISVIGFLAENTINDAGRATIVLKDTIEVMEINNDENYIVVYFPRQDIHALYALNGDLESSAEEYEMPEDESSGNK